ncbi:helix-turn-helix transcriptional regulator [Actinomadura sp. NPDC048032]|uniref:helix-turn-helix transcriptional regulator n=1 Tax=Actinomadura sp. NPDC048032 TaxID=3155747 RepID=UPI00340CE6F5
MSQPFRVTPPLLDVLEVFIQAHNENRDDLHGWPIAKATKRSGPTVYGVLERLLDAGWISGRWEDEIPQPNRPRRRYYRLTAEGLPAARQLLAERRPHSTPAKRASRPGFAFRIWRTALQGGR